MKRFTYSSPGPLPYIHSNAIDDELMLYSPGAEDEYIQNEVSISPKFAREEDAIVIEDIISSTEPIVEDDDVSIEDLVLWQMDDEGPAVYK